MQNSKLQFKIQNFYFLVVVFCFLFFVFNFTEAAILYLKPVSGEYYQNDTFIVNVRINPDEECVNTIQADLRFSKDVLEVEDVSKGNSIISFWVKEPEFYNETGLISFAGGIPGGYCGTLPGDPGESNLLGRIVFQVRETDAKPIRQTDAKVEFLDTSQVLLNDGIGTPAELSTKGAVFTVLSGIAETPKKEWQEELTEDKIPPEVFKIEISQDPSIFEGKYLITFSTTDKQTGIDYYQVKEGKKDWQETESPYLLKDQSLESIIKVRAVDKAGNERMAEYSPPREFPPYLIIILVLILIGVIYWLIRIRKIRK